MAEAAASEKQYRSTSQWVKIPIDGDLMPAHINLPNGSGPHPGVVVIHGRDGIDSLILTITERLAQAGFVGIAPDLYYREPSNLSKDEIDNRREHLQDTAVIKDVNAAITHLKERSFVRRDCIGIIGFCMGGRVSYLMAGSNADLRVAADFYGGGIMLPYGEGPTPFDRTANIGCPVIIFNGEEDRHPPPDEVRKIAAELTHYGVINEYHIFPGVGHTFMTGLLAKGSKRQAEAAAEAWDKCLNWFGRYLVQR